MSLSSTFADQLKLVAGHSDSGNDIIKAFVDATNPSVFDKEQREKALLDDK
jgi:hypothetical protein